MFFAIHCHCSLPLFFSAWGKEDTLCFLPLDCKKGPMTTVSTAALYGHKDDTYLPVLHPQSHLHTERCRGKLCVSVRGREKDEELLSLQPGLVSVAMKQQLRHCFRLPPRKGGKEGGRAHTGTAGGRKQRNHLGRRGHGESESEEGTVERGLDEKCGQVAFKKKVLCIRA